MLRVSINDTGLDEMGIDNGGNVIYNFQGKPFSGVVELDYHPNGNIDYEVEYINGFKDGRIRSYHENGQLAEERFQKHNHLCGVSRKWDENGTLIDETHCGPPPVIEWLKSESALALDVFYFGNSAKVVGCIFNWGDRKARQVEWMIVNGVEDYVPGEFYKRELPCLLAIIDQFSKADYDTIIVDGHVYISNNKEYGLGGKLWDALGNIRPIIGVAKTYFQGNAETVIEVKRGLSRKPLYVSSIGIDTEKAAELIKQMSGVFRIPTILKELDQETKRLP